MNCFRGLRSNFVSLFSLLCLLSSSLVLPAGAQEPSDENDLKMAREKNQEQPDLKNRGAKDPKDQGNITEGIVTLYDEKFFWPAMIATIPATAAYYALAARKLYVRLDGIVNRLKASHIDFAELKKIQAARIEFAKKFETLLAQASEANRAKALQLLPADVRQTVDSQLAARGRIAGEATRALEELVDGMNELHTLNVKEYEIIKKLGPAIEQNLKLPEGTIKTRFRHPDELLVDGYAVARKTASPVAFAAEQARFEKAVVREAGWKMALGPVPDAAAGANWVLPKTRWLELKKLRMKLPWWRPLDVWDTKSSLLFRKTVVRGIRITAPILLVGGSFLGYTYYLYASKKSKLAKDANIDTAKLRQALEEELAQKQFNLMEDSMLLTVEIVWDGIRTRYRKQGFAMNSPFAVGDAFSRELVKAAFVTTYIDLKMGQQDPFAKNEPDDKLAAEKMEELCEQLGIEVPPPHESLSMKFYKQFWLDLLQKARAMNGGEDLANIPGERKLEAERQLGAERPLITISELAHDMAIASPSALLRAGAAFREKSLTEEKLMELEAEAREKLLKDIAEADPAIAAIIQGRIAQRKAQEEASERGEKDLLPLDPETEKTNESEAEPAAEPEKSSEAPQPDLNDSLPLDKNE